MRAITPISIVVAILAAIGFLTIFTVYETDQAILLRLQKMQIDSTTGKPKVYAPGLHFKVPLIDTVLPFDTRLNTLEVRSRPIVTNEKKDVIVSFFVQWKIEDLSLFYTRTDGIKARAESLLEQKVIDGLRAEFGRRTIVEVVSGERDELMESLRRTADNDAEGLGISVKDVRIKQIDLPTEVSDAVYNRMRSERFRVAANFRAMGEKAANIIRANADNKVRVLMAEAGRDAKRIGAEGDAQALEIYANTYSQNPGLFEFMRSLDAYTHSFQDKNDILVLRPDGDFFKYFHGQQK